MFKKVKAIEELCQAGYEVGYAKSKNYEFKRENQVVSLFSKGTEIVRFVITGYEQGYTDFVSFNSRFEANAASTFVQYFGLDTVYEWKKV